MQRSKEVPNFAQLKELGFVQPTSATHDPKPDRTRYRTKSGVIELAVRGIVVNKSEPDGQKRYIVWQPTQAGLESVINNGHADPTKGEVVAGTFAEVSGGGSQPKRPEPVRAGKRAIDVA